MFNQGSGTSTSVSFDAAGNESAIGSASYAYSPRNLLASGDGITYVYDGFGQRVSATTTISGSSATETSLYDTSRHLQTETSLGSGSVAFDYVWFAGVPVAEEDIGGSHTYWTAVDHLGAPIILTNTSGAIAWQADYEPFGAIYQVRTGTSIHQPLRFPGQEAELFDGSQGANGFSLRYYNASRWYRPQWGRYTQTDPLSYSGSPINLYGYTGNNPLSYADASGMCSANDDKPPKKKSKDPNRPCDLPASVSIGSFPVFSSGIPINHAFIVVRIGGISTVIQAGPEYEDSISPGYLVSQNYPVSGHSTVPVSTDPGIAYATIQAGKNYGNYSRQWVTAGTTPSPQAGQSPDGSSLSDAPVNNSIPVNYNVGGTNSNAFAVSLLNYAGIPVNLSQVLGGFFIGDQSIVPSPDFDNPLGPPGPDNPCP